MNICYTLYIYIYIFKSDKAVRVCKRIFNYMIGNRSTLMFICRNFKHVKFCCLNMSWNLVSMLCYRRLLGGELYLQHYKAGMIMKQTAYNRENMIYYNANNAIKVRRSLILLPFPSLLHSRGGQSIYKGMYTRIGWTSNVWLDHISSTIF